MVIIPPASPVVSISVEPPIIHPPHSTVFSTEEGSAARLDCLELGERNGLAAEAGGQLGAVEVEALGGGDGAELVARDATDARLVVAVADGLLEGTVLLGVLAVAGEVGAAGGAVALAVGAEALGELAGRRLGVGLGSVIDGGWEVSAMSPGQGRTE